MNHRNAPAEPLRAANLRARTAPGPHLEYVELGDDGAGYPGHPLCIAYLVMVKYDSLEQALARDEITGSRCVLADGDIPGARGNVQSALAVLEHARDHGIEAGWKLGVARWENQMQCEYRDQAASGQAKAKMVRERFFDKAAVWLGAVE